MTNLESPKTPTFLTSVKRFIIKLFICSVAVIGMVWSGNYISDAYTYQGKFGFLGQVVRSVFQFPGDIYNVYLDLFQRDIFIEIDPDFEEVNKLPYDVYALNSNFQGDKWRVRLSNLKNDETILTWDLSESFFVQSSEHKFSHAPIKGAAILKDTSLVLASHESKNLYRINTQSELMWVNRELQFHHGINLDHNGDIWACTRGTSAYPYDISTVSEGIAKIDAETGKVVYSKSLLEIFLENDLAHIIYYENKVDAFRNYDPLHLNDVTPVLIDGELQQQGDVWLSIRHRSIVLQYRPSTGKVVRVVQGDFYCQHNVDLYSDTQITLFNNNVSYLYDYDEVKKAGLLSYISNNDSFNENVEVNVYDLEEDAYCALYPHQFEDLKIYTFEQGIHHLLANGDLYVEEWFTGKVYIFNEEEVLVNKYFNRPKDGYVERPSWVRIYEDLDFLKH